MIQDTYTITRDVTANVAKIVNSEGQTLYTKHYDPSGRLVSAVTGQYLFGEHSPVLKAALAYDSFGRRSEASFSDALSETVQYDAANEIQDIRWSKAYQPFVHEALSYDRAGNITEAVRENGVWSYGYDQTSQLTSAHSQNLDPMAKYEQEFIYDPAGNRIQDSRGGAANVVANAITSNSKALFSYDPNGFGAIAQERDTQSEQSKFFSYRPDGLMTSFSSTSNPVSSSQYSFDALGRRINKQITAIPGSPFTQSYAYLMDENRIFLAQAGDGARTLYLDGQGIDEHLGQINKGEARSYATDHLGSVLNSEVAGPSKSFGAFGESLGTKPFLSKTADSVVYGFTGRQYDAESDIYYYRARQYSPNLGRFMTSDPTSFSAGDINLYRYTGNNPTNSLDPTGTGPVASIICAAAVAAGAGKVLSVLGNYLNSQIAIHQQNIQDLNSVLAVATTAGDDANCSYTQGLISGEQSAITTLKAEELAAGAALGVGGVLSYSTCVALLAAPTI